MGRYREIEYEHILPDGKEKLGIWSKLWPNLDRILPTDERHPAFGNLNSSQAFAVNLFGGLKHTCLLAKALQVAFATGPLTDPNVTLEYFTPEFKKYLGEKGSHQTQVDVLATASEGARTRAFVIEVKLTEAAFGRCRGPFEEKNADKSICYPDSSGERRCRCFMASLEGRRYLELAERAFPLLAAVLGADGSCPIRLDGYQLARNLAVRAWLGGDLLPGAPPPPPPGPFEATFAVVSARDTPALSSGPLVALGSSPAERLSKLGVRWVDARHLVDAVSNEPTAGEFVEFMKSRYSPLFDEVAGQTG